MVAVVVDEDEVVVVVVVAVVEVVDELELDVVLEEVLEVVELEAEPEVRDVLELVDDEDSLLEVAVVEVVVVELGVDDVEWGLVLDVVREVEPVLAVELGLLEILVGALRVTKMPMDETASRAPTNAARTALETNFFLRLGSS